MIKLMVIGNLGKDCTVNTVNGKNVINFSVANTEKFKDSTGAQREKTTWVEWWQREQDHSPGMDFQQSRLIPFVRHGCSWHCVPRCRRT